MELKKSKEADLERLRIPFFLLGLLFISSLVLASFNYRIKNDSSLDSKRHQNNLAFQELNIKPDVRIVEVAINTSTSIDLSVAPSEFTITKANTKDTNSIAKFNNTSNISEGILNPIKEVEAEIFDFPDVRAAFPGGPAAMQQWLTKNVQYPKSSVASGEKGKVYVSFVVEANGSISNVQIDHGISDDLDREAKRLVRSMPIWIAGETRGKKVRTRFRLPINFSL